MDVLIWLKISLGGFGVYDSCILFDILLGYVLVLWKVADTFVWVACAYGVMVINHTL